MLVIIHKRKFFYLILTKDGLSFIKSSSNQTSDKIILRHDIRDTLRHVFLKFKIAVRNDTDQMLFRIDNRHTGNPEFAHQGFRIRKGMLRSKRKRIVDNAVLGTFYKINLLRLLVDGHVFMNNANTAFSCNRNGHTVFRNCIHGSAHDGNIQ